MLKRFTTLLMVALAVSSYCSPQLVMADAGSPALQAIDPSQAKTDTVPAAAAPPPSPNPLGRVNGAPVSGNRQPSTLAQPPYPVQSGYPPAGYQYPPGYGYPPQSQGYPPQTQGYPPQTQGYPPQTQGYPPQTQGYPPQTQGYPPTYPQQGYPAQYPNANPPQYTQPYGQPGYAPQGNSQPAYAPQGGYPPTGYPPAGYPSTGYPAARQGYAPQAAYPPAGYPAAGSYPSGNPQTGYPPPQSGYRPNTAAPPVSARPPAGYPNENMIPDFSKPLPAAPSRPPGSPPMPSGGQGWATNVPTPQASSDEDRVMKLEQAAFGSTYPEHEVEDRVDHLEKEVFGNTTTAAMPDRISKLETKLGGAGAFGHTNIPMPPGNGHGARSGSGGPRAVEQTSPNNLASAEPSSADQNSAPLQPQAEPSSSAPAAEQAMSAVAQSLDSPNPPVGQSSNSSPGQSSNPSAEESSDSPNSSGQSLNSPNPPAVHPFPSSNVGQSPRTPSSDHPSHTPITAPPPPIPLPKSSQVVATKKAKERPKLTAEVPRAAANLAANPPEVQSVIDAIPSDSKGGDYFAAIRKFDGNTVARWTSFPITVKLPAESPESWKNNLHAGISEWNRFIPVQAVPSSESSDIEVSWVNHLMPGVLGITRLTTPTRGNIHVEIWLLRPTFYVQDVPERAIKVAFLHELGHAIGIFGHSGSADDLMCSAELSLAAKGKAAPKSFTIEPRDLNTLKRVYDSPALPSGFLLPQPIEWSFQ
jgi:predicted Zn-dependent protease